LSGARQLRRPAGRRIASSTSGVRSSKSRLATRARRAWATTARSAWWTPIRRGVPARREDVTKTSTRSRSFPALHEARVPLAACRQRPRRASSASFTCLGR
jgi:hypothetical protein